MEEKIKLFGYYRSSCSYRVRIALNIKGIDYDNHPVHLVRDGGEQHQEDFLKLNPKGEVPALVHGKTTISQSMAIFSYLESLHPTPALFPEDAKEKAFCIQACEIVNSGIQPLQNLKVMNYLKERGLGNKEDADVREWCAHWIHTGFVALEKFLKALHRKGPYCLGKEFSAVDAFLVPQAYNANRFEVPMKAFPHLNEINQECLKRKEVQQALPENQQDAPTA